MKSLLIDIESPSSGDDTPEDVVFQDDTCSGNSTLISQEILRDSARLEFVERTK